MHKIKLDNGACNWHYKDWVVWLNPSATGGKYFVARKNDELVQFAANTLSEAESLIRRAERPARLERHIDHALRRRREYLEFTLESNARRGEPLDTLDEYDIDELKELDDSVKYAYQLRDKFRANPH